MADKLGVYICGGCGISDVVNVESLQKVAGAAVSCQVHEHLCGPEGLALIKQDVEGDEAKVNSVVIAACSPRMKMDAFQFGPNIVVERANIREHVAWTQKADDEDVPLMAEDYLRMSIVKAQKMEPPVPLDEEISKKLMVVGGGITGIT
ncbi:MAG: heterodisulfide reductase subunit A, partial [bacterium]|nr:heterodisulfide reductase subunit A [bacterium]